MQDDGNKAQSSLLKNSSKSLIRASASEASYVQNAIAYRMSFSSNHLSIEETKEWDSVS